jgi:peptide/nickel transport system substrate-binding protein
MGQSTATVVTTTATGNWWDSLGMPQYGGTMTIRINQDITDFDPTSNSFTVGIFSAWMERLFADNWTINPSTYLFQLQYRGSDYTAGQLAQSWEFTDPNTFVVQLRQDVYWQNLPPANGRQFVAADVVAHYMQMYDSKNGAFDLTGPHATTQQGLTSVTATGNYTVTFKYSIANPEIIYEALMLSGTSENCIANPETVTQYGNLNNWHNAIGTGPFILTDFVDTSSAALVRNPNYWGHDERYPQNRLPYIDKLNILIISQDATAIAAMRTGKIDALDGMSVQAAQGMQQTDPEITQIKVPYPSGLSIDPKVDVAPYNNLQVREALQMAINLPQIATNYFLGTSSDPDPMTSEYMIGWGFPYNQWPQSLKDQFAYNPTQAKALLSQAGFPNGFNTDIIVDTNFDMDLLQIIQSEFAAINVNMSIQTMPYATWTAYVSTGHKQDALAANYTGQLGRTTEPMTQIAKFYSTTSTNYEDIHDPAYDAIYAQALAATTLDGVKAALLSANQYILQQHYLISLVQPMTFSFVQPWLKGYNGQNNGLSGSYGPSLLFFYPARFWIVPH